MMSFTAGPSGIRLVKRLSAAASVVLALAFCATPWGGALERLGYDLQFLLRGPLPVGDDVVVVAIDEASFGALERQWPWPRRLHADLLEALFDAGARTVAFDILFAEPSNAADDARLAESLSRRGNVVLASDRSSSRGAGFTRDIDVNPLPAFTAGGAASGLVSLPVDNDGFVRRLAGDEAPLAAFSRVAARLHAPGLEDAAGGGLINFAGPPGHLETVSYYQALEPDRFLREDFLRDKLVFVGLSTHSEVQADAAPRDRYPVPFSRWGTGYMSGVEIHANAAWSLLGHRVVREVTPLPAIVIALVLGVATCLVAYRYKPVAAGFASAAILAAVLGTIHWLFTTRHLYLSLSLATMPIVFAYLSSPFVHYVVTWRERNFIRRAFSTYLAPRVVDALVAQPERLALGGREAEGSVMFLDLAGFTTFSERLAPEALIDLLNRNLGHLSEVILDHDGLIDKFIGDAVMAEWGVPLPQADHAQRACAAALGVQSKLEALAAEEAKHSGVELLARIGINSGRFVAGNIGGARQVNYTVLGNDVNLASRLEGINKAYGTRIIIGEETARLAGSSFVLRELDSLRVKGQNRPVTVYELVGRAGEVEAAHRQTLAGYAEALALYRERDFAAAKERFSKVLAGDPDDGPSRVFVERCALYLERPPPPDWDGVFVMTTK